MLESIYSSEFTRRSEYIRTMNFLHRGNILSPARGHSFVYINGIATNQTSISFLELMSAANVLTYSQINRTITMPSANHHSEHATNKDEDALESTLEYEACSVDIKIDYLQIETVDMDIFFLRANQYLAALDQGSSSSKTHSLNI